MSWVFLALTSSLFLGFYDILKKVSLKNNAVFPTLLGVTITGSILMLPSVLAGSFFPESALGRSAYAVLPISKEAHAYIFLKSIIVTASWVMSYLAIRNLPITIVTPIRATSPLWTLMGALILFGERLNTLQWVGIAITLGFFYLFSLAGKKEGIHFKNNIWIGCIILGTLLGACSSLYDKYLLQHFDRLAIQAWFTIYQVILLIPIIYFYWRPRKAKYPFTWKWSIAFIALFLLITDFIYFKALSMPDSLVSIVSAIRRSGVVVAFGFGALFFKEKNIKQKGVFLIGILIGIFLLVYAS